MKYEFQDVPYIRESLGIANKLNSKLGIILQNKPSEDRQLKQKVAK
jgi:hypothetical protein